MLKIRGEAMRRLNQWGQAQQAMEEARQGAEQREDLPLLWQIHRLLGLLHKKQKNTEGAEREFARARQALEGLGANIGEESLRAAFLQAAWETLPKERQGSRREQFGGLTPREREVAGFLSQGKSNREIAEALVLSERTVENHVGNILNKLGFDSRAQIAVWVVEKGLGKEKN